MDFTWSYWRMKKIWCVNTKVLSTHYVREEKETENTRICLINRVKTLNSRAALLLLRIFVIF
jgi:hypothetical protein